MEPLKVLQISPGVAANACHLSPREVEARRKMKVLGHLVCIMSSRPARAVKQDSETNKPNKQTSKCV